MAYPIRLNNISAEVDIAPDVCPLCHFGIHPKPLFAYAPNDARGIRELRVVFKCPRHQCCEIFIGYYEHTVRRGPTHAPEGLFLQRLEPKNALKRVFDPQITRISALFCDIYNESAEAEANRLAQICGVGYRKALEFLIKDYLIERSPADADATKKEFLGTCINTRVSDPNVMEVAKRAVWLGNDQTHYERRWVDKDLRDLKTLIDLVIHWIMAEHLTNQAISSMPNP